jgi:hypothetical protein
MRERRSVLLYFCPDLLLDILLYFVDRTIAASWGIIFMLKSSLITTPCDHVLAFRSISVRTSLLLSWLHPRNKPRSSADLFRVVDFMHVLSTLAFTSCKDAIRLSLRTCANCM